MSDQGTSSTKEATQQAASDVANAAADQAKAVSSAAKDQARQVTGEATSQLTSLTSQAKDHATDLLSTTTTELNEQLGDRLSRAAVTARERADQLGALAEGRVDEAGPLSDWARQASDRLRRLADRADELGPRGVVDEVSDFARRRPAAFLFGAGLAGVMVGRLARAGKEVDGSAGSGSHESSSAGLLPAETSPTSSRDRGQAVSDSPTGSQATSAGLEPPLGATPTGVGGPGTQTGGTLP